ncbi:MAG: Xylose isomerase domain protein barrel [Verrucomicrobiales bacterium]|nr:Xylose isomerase domain protein barrel [Verrucomicrobiales bacterium]
MTNNLNPLSRRNFLGMAAAVPALALATSMNRASAADAPDAAATGGAMKKRPMGLELYSVRGEFMKDWKTTLKNVADMGYECVEFWAPYYDWSIPHAKETRTFIEDHGMRCYSTHNPLKSFMGDTMAKAIELNQILGTRHLILSSAGNLKTSQAWKDLGGKLTTAVEQLKPHGLTAGFHNHQTEWAKLDDGQRAMDVLAASTPPEFVLQFDVGTCMEAGADPIAWIKANPGRIKSLHLKEWAPGARETEKGYRTLFGEGISPWKEIIAAAESVGGAEFYLMEQEGSRYPEFETAKRCLDNWKAFRAKS